MENSDKPFNTLEGQVNLLEEKGIIIQDVDYAKNELMKRGYYSLINGYKNLFLERDENGELLIPHQYTMETKFEDFVNLYEFDKKLRAILYNGLLSYEASLGAEIAYRFSEAFPKEYSYLDINNFNHDDNDTVQVLKTINFIRIDIKDNGIGIDKSEYNDIFKRFYRSEKVDDIEGSGVGLYLTRKILERQGGNIIVSSQKEQGSKFSLFLTKV